jgi:ferredoxin
MNLPGSSMSIPLLDRAVRPSTRAFRREWKKIPGYSFWRFLHGYVYGRWPYLYIGIATGEHPAARAISRFLSWFGKWSPLRPVGSPPAPPTPSGAAFADTYHGKVIPLDRAREIVSIDRDIAGSYPEQVIPYHHARQIILTNPLSIVLLDCPCRKSREHPCLPLDVCLVIGEPFASFILEHQPERSRRVTPAEALAVLEAEDARGHVHHAFFKDVMLERFYAICNCCSCCCGAMQAQRNGTPMLASSGYVAHVDGELCAGCETCVSVCQFYAPTMKNGKAVIDPALCMGCGVCVNHCQHEALRLERDPARGEPLEVRALVEGINERSN